MMYFTNLFKVVSSSLLFYMHETFTFPIKPNKKIFNRFGQFSLGILILLS